MGTVLICRVDGTQTVEEREILEVVVTADELRARYDGRAVELIRDQYSADDEYKILREYLAYKDTNPETVTAFTCYNVYVESCKAQAHAEVYGDVT